MRRWKPGDVVDEKEVDRIVLELLPTTYRDDLRQAGEAFSRAIDPDTEMPAYTHMTFAKMVSLDGPDYRSWRAHASHGNCRNLVLEFDQRVQKIFSEGRSETRGTKN